MFAAVASGVKRPVLYSLLRTGVLELAPDFDVSEILILFSPANKPEMPLSATLVSPNITTCSNITQAALANVTGNVSSVAGYMGIVVNEELPSLRDSIIEVILLTMLIGTLLAADM